MGGVLLTNGWDHRERAEVLPRFGLDVATFEAKHPEPYAKWERGACTAREYLDATVFYEPRTFTHEEFLSAICAMSSILEDSALGILGELAASDKCMIGALNNEARETNEFRFEKFGLRKYFSVALSSCYVGLRKPDEAIYRQALDILGRPAGRVLFIDDRAENAAGAAAVGMDTIHYTGHEALRAALAERGVL